MSGLSLPRAIALAVVLLIGEWAAPAAGFPASPSVSEEKAIRALVLRYEEAIEGQDIELFQSVKPDLSDEERQRLERSFRSIRSHEVEIAIVSIVVVASGGRVVVRRRDVLNAGTAAEVVSAFPQTLELAIEGSAWHIQSIGR